MDLMTTAHVAFTLGVALLAIAVRLARTAYERHLSACAAGVLATTAGIILVTNEASLNAASIDQLIALFTYQAVGLCVMAAIVIRHKVLDQRSGTSRQTQRRVPRADL